MNATCPECEANFQLPESTVVNEVIPCPDCGVELEVFKIAQAIATLGLAPQEAEDWGE